MPDIELQILLAEVERLRAEVESLSAFPRFWAFACDQYYPNGGDNDCVGRFASLDEAIAALKTGHSHDEAWVVDCTTGETVWGCY